MSIENEQVLETCTTADLAELERLRAAEARLSTLLEGSSPHSLLSVRRVLAAWSGEGARAPGVDLARGVSLQGNLVEEAVDFFDRILGPEPDRMVH